MESIYRSHVTIDIELRLEKCTRDYSNETVKHSPTVFAILVLSIIDTFFITIVQILKIT